MPFTWPNILIDRWGNDIYVLEEGRLVPIIKEHRMTNEQRIEIERKIATRIVEDALKHNYAISVNNGGDDHEVSRATNKETILENMFASDEDRLIFHVILSDGKPSLTSIGWVDLVYGNNGFDVIHDYLINDATTEILKGAEQLTQELEKAKA